jgi:hypothetical protein
MCFLELVRVACKASNAGASEYAVEPLLVGEGAGAVFVLDSYDEQGLSHAVQCLVDSASPEQLAPGHVRFLFEVCCELVVRWPFDGDYDLGVDCKV